MRFEAWEADGSEGYVAMRRRIEAEGPVIE
jgi:hypothetical protein